MHTNKIKKTKEDLDKEKEKVNEYLELVKTFKTLIKSEESDKEAIEVSSRILDLNPEHYTVWNWRRRLLLKLSSSSTELLESQAQKELDFSQECFKRNPKSYWIWCHRKWVLTHMPDPPWKRELLGISYMLSKDCRNFHAWSYRKWVVDMSKIAAPKEELDYTTSKIKENFSNYSAWHYRSTLIPMAFSSDIEKNEFLIRDLDLVRNAVYTEPKDQSSWFYQKWLLSQAALQLEPILSKELSLMQDLFDMEPNCKEAENSIKLLKSLLESHK